MITHKQIMFACHDSIEKQFKRTVKIRCTRENYDEPFDYYKKFHLFLLSYNTFKSIRFDVVFSKVLTDNRLLEMIKREDACFKWAIISCCRTSLLKILSKDEDEEIRYLAKKEIHALNSSL